MALCVAAPTFASEQLAKPTSAVILSVSGNLIRTNTPGRADFDRPMLEALGMQTLVTTTPWNDCPQTFEGIPLKRIFDALEARGDTITGIALNDYKSQIPFADTTTYNPLVALKRNGVYMAIKDKGPLWIVYPRTAHKELSKVEYNHRWIWQLRSLHVQ